MKLYYAIQSDAQAKADSIHSQMVAASPAYAQSVAAGQTKRWDVPAQDRDALGNIILTSQWGVNVDGRVTPVLTPTEVQSAGLATSTPTA